MLRRIVLSLAVAGLLPGRAAAADPGEDWPQFRGPNGSGVSVHGSFPIHFGPESNVVWKAALPPGHSSACIWGDRIFLTGREGPKLETICLDRSRGRILWRAAVQPDEIERGSYNSDPAASTPATDGLRVYVYFGSFGLLAYDFSGRELWRRPLPIPVTQHGSGTSPVLANQLVLLNRDQDIGAHLLAVKADTGATAWQAERPSYRRGFSTPVVWPPGQPEIAILPGTLRLVAYNLTDGSERWQVNGLPNETVASPVVGDDLIYVAGWTPGAGVSRMPEFTSLLEQGDRNGDGKLTRDEAPSGPAKQHFVYIDADKDGLVTREEYDSIARIFGESRNVLMAVRPGGQGDVTASHVVWTQTRGLPYVPSPLLYQGRIFLVRNGGLASAFDARTGKAFYQEERLGALGDYYASPVAANGLICATSQPGVLVIYRAGETLEVLARNPMGEPTMATPAIVGNRIYVRTKSALYAFGEPAR